MQLLRPFLLGMLSICSCAYDAPTTDLAVSAAQSTAAFCTSKFSPTLQVSPSQLAAVLNTASSGDIIEVSAGEFRGSLSVPAGVALIGAGVTIVAEGGAGLKITGGTASTPTVIRGFSLLVPEGGSAVAAIIAVGGGSVVLDEISVDAAVGAGLIGEGIDDLQVCSSIFSGRVDDDAFAALRDMPIVSASDAAILGIVITAGESLQKTRVRLSDVEIQDFAGFGAAFVDSEVAWTRGTVTGCAGTSVYLARSSHEWTDVVISDGRASSSGTPTFQNGWGVVSVDGSRLTTDGMQIAGIPGPGFFQSGSKSQHLGARVVGNSSRGVIVQDSVSNSADDPELLFDQSVIAFNGGAGIQVVDGGGVVFQNGILAESRTVPTLGGFGDASELIGDGIQLNSAPESSVGSQFRASRSVVFGNGKSGINAKGGGTSLVPLDSDSVTVCGANAIDETRWSCSSSPDGVLECLRSSGPAVTSEWSCNDLDGKTICSSSSPSSSDSLAPDFPLLATDAGVPIFCKDAASAIVRENRLVVSAGVVALNAAPGFQGTSRSSSGTGYRWTCVTESDSRVCTSSEIDRVSADDFDNPSLTQGSGWNCDYNSLGRRCSWSGFGIAADPAVNGAESFRPQVEARVFSRDSLLRSGNLMAPFMDIRRDRSKVPGLAGGVRSIVGENGIVRPDGAIGSNAIVGENGIIGENG